jgi:hypothetical protein
MGGAMLEGMIAAIYARIMVGGSMLLALLCLLTLATPCVWAQTADEVNFEKTLRDLEQVVDTRVAGYTVRAVALTEQADRAIQDRQDPSPRPDCQNPPRVIEVDVVTAELQSALQTVISRLNEDDRVYRDRLREYNAHPPYNTRKTDMYFALKLQRLNLLQLRSKSRNLVSISKSWSRAATETTITVGMAACLTRDPALLAELQRLTSDYRALLNRVQ